MQHCYLDHAQNPLLGYVSSVSQNTRGSHSCLFPSEPPLQSASKPREAGNTLFPLGEKHIKYFVLQPSCQDTEVSKSYPFSDQMWDQIYCKGLLLAHELLRKSLMSWAQFGAIIASLVSPMRFIISRNFDTSPVETQWIVLLVGTCQCFRTPLFPQQRHLPSAAKWDGDSLYLVSNISIFGMF